MAVPKGQAPKQARNGMAGSWFWLALSFAATLYFIFAGPRFDAVIDTLLGSAFVVAVAVALWSTAGRVLGAALRAVAPRPAPIWIFRMNGWTVVTLATGILLALQAGDNPKAFRTSDAVAVNLISMALLGLVWFLVFDLARAALARVAGRATPPILSVGTLAFLAGLGAIAWTVHGYFEGNLTEPPFDAGLAHLGIVLGVGAVLTLVIELPRALLARNARLGRSGGDSSLATTRAKLAGQLRVRTAEPDSGSSIRATTFKIGFALQCGGDDRLKVWGVDRQRRAACSLDDQPDRDKFRNRLPAIHTPCGVWRCCHRNVLNSHLQLSRRDTILWSC